MSKFGRRTALFCAGMIGAFLLAGCGGSGEENEADAPKTNESSAVDAEGGEKSMGRYLEREITVPEEIRTASSYPAACLQKQGGGELVLAEMLAGRYVSADAGESWEYTDCFWQDLIPAAYLADISLSPDGAAAVVYSPYAEDGESAGGEFADGEASDGAGSSGQEADGAGDGGTDATGSSGKGADAVGDGSAGAAESFSAEAEESEEEAGTDTGQDSYEMVWKAAYFDPEGTGRSWTFRRAAIRGYLSLHLTKKADFTGLRLTAGYTGSILRTVRRRSCLIRRGSRISSVLRSNIWLGLPPEMRLSFMIWKRRR